MRFGQIPCKIWIFINQGQFSFSCFFSTYIREIRQILQKQRYLFSSSLLICFLSDMGLGSLRSTLIQLLWHVKEVSHHLTISPSHHFPISLSHHLTISPSHHLTILGQQFNCLSNKTENQTKDAL